MICLMLISGRLEAQSSCGYEVSTIIIAPDCPDPFCHETYGQGLSESINGGLPYVVGNIKKLGFNDAYFWSEKTGMVLLDMPAGAFTSIARGISPDGRFIVGDYDINNDTFNNLGFLIDDGKFIEIDPAFPPPQASFSQLFAVNSSRQVTGTTVDPVTGYKRAFFWQDGEMILIEPTFGPRTSGRAINEAGTIVGWMGTGFGVDAHGFVWDGNKVIDIGFFPNTFSTWGFAISADGQVLVRASFADDEPNGRAGGAFLWSKDNKAVDLGTLPGYISTVGYDLNDHGQVVGLLSSLQDPKYPSVGFIWHDGVITKLNDLLPPDSQLNVFRAYAINNEGQITGVASDENHDVVSFILTPVDKPIGDVDGDCEVGLNDLSFLLDSWGLCSDCTSCPADLNQDCKVSTIDLLLLFSNWG